MCGRFAWYSGIDRARAVVGHPKRLAGRVAHYNVSPGTDILNARRCGAPDEGAFSYYDRGLIPGWVPADYHGPQPISAKRESLTRGGLYRAAIRYHRSPIFCDGFYGSDKSDSKPYPQRYLCRRDGELVAMAGLYAKG